MWGFTQGTSSLPLSDQKIDTCKNFVFKKEACIRQRNVLPFFHVLFYPRVWIMIAGTDTDDNDNKDKGFDNDVFNYSGCHYQNIHLDLMLRRKNNTHTNNYNKRDAAR